MPELDRRDFLKLVGVGAGGAAAGGCADHVEKLIPYVIQPEEITPGIPVFYASTCQECPAGCGLHVRTREGRPIKLEGNPAHPVNQGALCARGQAGIGHTYHPDRFRSALLRGADEAVGAGPRLVYEPFAYEALREASRAVFGVASRPIFDLSRSDYVIDFGADVMDAWLSPAEHQRQIKAARDVGSEEGRRARLVYVGPRLSTTAGNADEWLPARPGTEGILALGIARLAFEQRRALGKPVGGDPELIAGVLQDFGAEAVAERTGVGVEAIRRIGREIGAARRAVALPPGVALTSRRATATAGAVLLLDAVVGAVGRSVSVPPEEQGGEAAAQRAEGERRQAPAEQGGEAAAQRARKAEGRAASRRRAEAGSRETGERRRAPAEPAPAASMRDVAKFIDSLESGDVALLLIHDSNPAYSLPPAAGFVEALEKVGFVVSFASLADETAQKADLILPDHTPMESWGDAAPRSGVRSLVQPTIRPLYETQALGDTLLAAARAMGDRVAARLPAGSFRDVLEAAWADTDWREALARGGVWAVPAPSAADLAPSAARLDFEEPQLEGGGPYALLPVPSPLLYDGRGANLPWLQETPDPVTKIAWQSWAEVSRETAEKLGVEEGDVVAIETSFGRAEVPVLPRGGIRDDVVALAIGQGHSVGLFASREGDGRPGQTRGANAIALLPALTDETGGRAWLTANATLTPTGVHRRLPKTQRSDNKRGRQLGESLALTALAKGDRKGEAAAAEPGSPHGEGFHEIRESFDPTRVAVENAFDDSPYRWGMTVDLDRCSGCSACVVACSIENNVVTVGEEGVLRNRQMQWIRIERFLGEGEQELLRGRQRPKDREELGGVDVRHSPMMCQQCAAAPCESVCPVMATYHNPEGLNGMIYNRCIGTRYCSNNCPYKVRHYNWFDYAIHNWPEPMQYLLNPDVTVRGQGVMEKCSFCIQRIESARQVAKDAGRPIADGEITPACVQTCPSQAITFGNLKDEASAASKLAREGQVRAYHALHALNTRPGVTYLAKVARGQGGEAAAQRAEGERRRAPAEQGGEAAAQRAEGERRRAPAEQGGEAAAQRAEGERRRAPAKQEKLG
jgi:molybdopterin-containing oxidoreductase family iron-sulfur binding subunit